MMNRIGALAFLILLGACASTGATFRSGVGDRFLEHPPYYAGQSLAVVRAAPRIARLPIEFQRGASQLASFDPPSGAGSSVAALVAEMNAFLDSTLTGEVPRVARDGNVAPNVYFGCEQDASDDCVARGDSALGRRGTTMRLAVERPSPAWIARAAALLDSTGSSHTLVITLEIGQHWNRQTGWRGEKSMELGTAYIVPLPWLTSLETPVSVLQVTGVLVDREGRAVRTGAEGIMAPRSPLLASAVGAQRMFVEADVQVARTLRRSDLPGEPLAWRQALCQLVAQLTAKHCM